MSDEELLNALNVRFVVLLFLTIVTSLLGSVLATMFYVTLLNR